MRPSFAFAVYFMVAISGSAFADSLYTFTLTGDGHTFQFTLPDPPTVTNHPHSVQVGFSNANGTVDGTGGYTFFGNFVVALPLPGVPVLQLTASPDAPGIAPPYTPRGDNYSLTGPLFTTLVSDVPNPIPSCSLGVCNDLLTFAFVPAQYTLYGFDPDNNQGYYTLDITPAAATGVTPEPPSLLLALAGVIAGATWTRRRGLRQEDLTSATHRSPCLA